MADKKKVVCALSTGAIYSDLEPLTHISSDTIIQR